MLLIGVASQAYGQSATIRGFITDRSDGQPLELVNVVLVQGDVQNLVEVEERYTVGWLIGFGPTGDPIFGFVEGGYRVTTSWVPDVEAIEAARFASPTG